MCFAILHIFQTSFELRLFTVSPLIWKAGIIPELAGRLVFIQLVLTNLRYFLYHFFAKVWLQTMYFSSFLDIGQFYPDISYYSIALFYSPVMGKARKKSLVRKAGAHGCTVVRMPCIPWEKLLFGNSLNHNMVFFPKF